jgi:hypothetical protein
VHEEARPLCNKVNRATFSFIFFLHGLTQFPTLTVPALPRRNWLNELRVEPLTNPPVAGIQLVTIGGSLTMRSAERYPCCRPNGPDVQHPLRGPGGRERPAVEPPRGRLRQCMLEVPAAP